MKFLYDEMKRVFNRWQTTYRVATKIPRQWSDASGTFKVQANLVDRTATEVHLARLDNGQTVTVPIARLSATDQEIIKTFAVLQIAH